MKVKSAILTEMSGKIGGAVASKARGDIQYFRKLVTPANPGTAMQKAARGGAASASARWQNELTEDQQELWWDIATGSQTGQTLYNKVNQPRIFAVASTRFTNLDDATTPNPIDTPPLSLSTPLTSPGTIVIDDSSNTLTITGLNSDPYQTDATEEAPGTLYVYVSHQQNSSRFSRQHAYVLARAFNFATPNAAPGAINLAAIGITTQAGKVMYVRMVAQHPTGGVSTDLISRVTIVA